MMAQEAMDGLLELAEEGDEGDTPLHMLVDFPLAHPSTAMLVRALLAQGLDPNARNARGLTPLLVLAEDAVMSAAWEDEAEREGREDVVRVLLAAGADPTLSPRGGALCITPFDAFPAVLEAVGTSPVRH